MSAIGVFYDVASSRLDEQIGRIDALDGKTSTIYGFTAALLPIFGVFFATTNPPTPAAALYVTRSSFTLVSWSPQRRPTG
jgi:hypothetical protein